MRGESGGEVLSRAPKTTNGELVDRRMGVISAFASQQLRCTLHLSCFSSRLLRAWVKTRWEVILGDLSSTPLIGPSDMQIVERVLNMQSGYVLDFSDRTFNEFIGHELGVDATAARYSVDGGSKARRFRRILHSATAGQQAKLLRALLKYRDSPARGSKAEKLDAEWRDSYEQIISELEAKVPSADIVHAASAWTGRRTLGEQVMLVRELAPLAARELDSLAAMVERQRFNDEVTGDAIECLRELHRQLGELISAVDGGGLTREAVAAIERNRKQLLQLVNDGAKLTLVAPAMTFGIMHLLSWLTGVEVDSTLVSSIYGTVVAADVLKSLGKKTSLSSV